jgi:hypothetical protein
VDEDDKRAANMLARKRGIMVGKVENAAGLKGVKGTIKWPPFLSTFVLNTMCELIKSGVKKKGVQEDALDQCCQERLQLLSVGSILTGGVQPPV